MDEDFINSEAESNDWPHEQYEECIEIFKGNGSSPKGDEPTKSSVKELSKSDKIKKLVQSEEYCREMKLNDAMSDEAKTRYLTDNFSDEDINQHYSEVFGDLNEGNYTHEFDTKDENPFELYDKPGRDKVTAFIKTAIRNGKITAQNVNDNSILQKLAKTGADDSASRSAIAKFIEGDKDWFEMNEGKDKINPKIEKLAKNDKFWDDYLSIPNSHIEKYNEEPGEDLTYEERIDYLKNNFNDEDIDQMCAEIEGDDLSETKKEKLNDADEWQKIKEEILAEWGYDEDDMDQEDTEDEVNREVDDRFEEKFGREKVELPTSVKGEDLKENNYDEIERLVEARLAGKLKR